MPPRAPAANPIMPMAGPRPVAAPATAGESGAAPAAKPQAADSGGSPADTGAADASPTPSDAAVAAATSGPLQLQSEVWGDGQQLDPRHRCPGPSPDLRWSGAPSETRGYALVLRDRSNSFLHWLLYDIPGAVTQLPEGVPSGAMLDDPQGAKQGASYNGTRGYVGPCGRNNNPCELTLHALDVATLPDLSANAGTNQVIAAIEQHSLESTQVTAMSGPGD